MNNRLLNSIPILSIAILILLNAYILNQTQLPEKKSFVKKWSSKKQKVKSGEEAYMQPDGFIEYYNAISKRIDTDQSSYRSGYKYNELQKSFQNKAKSRVVPLDAIFTSRGPGNVGGRTRAIAVDPADATNCTWIAGAASGGIWKTIDCGNSWENLSPDLPNLSTNSIAQAQSNPNTIYVGTGEVFAGNSSFVRGDGIYKSTDRGNKWELLPSTVGNVDYQSVNRIAVDPENENIVVIATNSGVFKSLDGGDSWNKTYNATQGAFVQDLQVDPNDFNIQYAGVNGIGIIKSINGGNSWTNSSNGIAEGERFEIAISPSNPNILYTSTFSGENTLVYLSENKGENWILVDDPNYNTNFLGAQGWYDNTIAVNPYNPYEVFVGGVSIGKYSIDPDNISESDRQFIGVEAEGTPVFSLFNFQAAFNGGSLAIADGNNSPSNAPVSVEVRIGEDNAQKAHRFTVPDGATSGVPIANYSYQDYVEVPFEVWDIENNRQLMVSFRDQENNGIFNLNKTSQTDDGYSTAREYIYIHDVAYSESAPTPEVAVDGGIEYANMYFFWPVLQESATWNPATFENSIFRINYGTQFIAAAEAQAVYDAYGNWENQNRNNLHPDHHHLTLIKIDDASEIFMIVNGNDGGLGISENNGELINQITDGYVTTQFYGADKKPGEDRYIGGMQDNGTWISSGNEVDETNQYNFVLGGDGFEVIWHATDPQKVIGGYQFNGIARSTNGGSSFSLATNGITDGPFITRLAGSTTNPDVIYAIGNEGVYKSINFGETWTMKPINDSGWDNRSVSATDVEVSLANDQIVWAGAGMANSLSLFVSTDAGETYNAVNNYNPNPQAFYTGIYTHPSEENTAYALFSVANFPKILKTTDLGQNWEDISGFAGNANGSDRGFPDVFVHSLLVMPFNTDVIWVGTEIGLYESLDGGLSWNIRDDFPAASVWSMKLVDDQIVLGTHGRGIWTATLGELAKENLQIADFNYLGFGDAEIELFLPASYEEVSLLIDGAEKAKLTSPTSGKNTIKLSDYFDFDAVTIEIIGKYQGEEYRSAIFNAPTINAAPQIFSALSSRNGDVFQVEIEIENNEFFDQVEVLFNQNVVHTDFQVLERTAASRVITFDYAEIANNNLQIKAYLGDFVFTSTFQELLVTSSREEMEQAIRIFPNPAQHQLHIRSNQYDIQSIKLYSAAGAFIQNFDTKPLLDVSSLAAGTYLLQLTDTKGRIVSKRFIKK